MRVELTAIKAAIEVAIMHEIDMDADVPNELLNDMAALHSRIDKLENPGGPIAQAAQPADGLRVRSIDEIERDQGADPIPRSAIAGEI
ncbi:MAG: hypothetical protein KKB59_10345 [Spirochaetes bacterium]|nr:hypothetical protein [Spirochaetota bacterium]